MSQLNDPHARFLQGGGDEGRVFGCELKIDDVASIP
jgi:hypothetical protein